MFIENRDVFTEVIDITLYKYNSIDVKIWGLIQRDVVNKKLTEESYLVPVHQMQQYLHKWFSYDINRFQSVNDMTIHKEATSVYFIWQILQNTPNLSWIKVNLNKNLTYNRIINIDQIKTIKYSTKTIRGSLRLFDIFAPRELNIVNSILEQCHILDGTQMYKVIKLKTFMNILDGYLSEDSANETFGIVNTIIQRLEVYEVDDPEMLLITDRNSDI
jgi:hypothetical protein